MPKKKKEFKSMCGSKTVAAIRWVSKLDDNALGLMRSLRKEVVQDQVSLRTIANSRLQPLRLQRSPSMLGAFGLVGVRPL